MIRITALICLCALSFTGCDKIPGKPSPDSKWKPASATVDFGALYGRNCIGCHGLGDKVSASISMDNPTYLSVIPRATLIAVIANGVHRTAMPGFSAAAGGPLTEQQIEILADGILARKPATAPAQLPPYAGELGDATRGASAFAASCGSCHGDNGAGGAKAGSVVDSAYLGLVSDQYLRTITIAGRPDLGCPDFASRTPGRPMTAESIADVVAWLASNRRNEFGKPLDPAAKSKP